MCSKHIVMDGSFLSASRMSRWILFKSFVSLPVFVCSLVGQLLDVAISLAKVADVDFALGNESAAAEGFQEALKKLENLSPPKSGDTTMLEKKVRCSNDWFYLQPALFVCLRYDLSPQWAFISD